MCKEDINKKRLVEITKISEKLNEFSNYTRDVNINKIINWTKEDIKEIYRIKNNLQIKGKLEKAYKIKEITEIKKIEQKELNKKIIEIYQIINKELNSWREVSFII